MRPAGQYRIEGLLLESSKAGQYAPSSAWLVGFGWGAVEAHDDGLYAIGLVMSHHYRLALIERDTHGDNRRSE